MKQFSKDLGNVSLAPKGKWSREQEYERLALVYNAYNNLSYVAKINVPSGVDIENREYWQPMNATGYADNNFINLTIENKNGTITAYESIEEAIATIVPINRRVGATLSFYNLNSDRLDRQAEFELWQFNSTDLANWENKDYWNNIYYNWNVFVGWYIGDDALKNHVKLPTIGQYGYVGSNLNDAILYQCRTNGTWTNTGTKVRNYISVVVSGNITIGDNGNWFSDDKDTGIPATPAVDEQLDNIVLQLQQHNTEINSIKEYNENLQDQITSNDNDITNLTAKHESLSRTVQGIAATGGASTATNVTYDKTNSGLNAENAQDAIDELQSSKFDKTSILQESGEAEDKVMSQKVVSDKFNGVDKQIGIASGSYQFISRCDILGDIWKKGFKINTSGQEEANPSYFATDFIDVTNISDLGFCTRNYADVINIAAYSDKDEGTFIADNSIGNISDYEDKVVCGIWTKKENTKYIKLCMKPFREGFAYSGFTIYKYNIPCYVSYNFSINNNATTMADGYKHKGYVIPYNKKGLYVDFTLDASSTTGNQVYYRIYIFSKDFKYLNKTINQFVSQNFFDNNSISEMLLDGYTLDDIGFILVHGAFGSISIYTEEDDVKIKRNLFSTLDENLSTKYSDKLIEAENIKCENIEHVFNIEYKDAIIVKVKNQSDLENLLFEHQEDGTKTRNTKSGLYKAIEDNYASHKNYIVEFYDGVYLLANANYDHGLYFINNVFVDYPNVNLLFRNAPGNSNVILLSDGLQYTFNDENITVNKRDKVTGLKEVFNLQPIIFPTHYAVEYKGDVDNLHLSEFVDDNYEEVEISSLKDITIDNCVYDYDYTWENNIGKFKLPSDLTWLNLTEQQCELTYCYFRCSNGYSSARGKVIKIEDGYVYISSQRPSIWGPYRRVKIYNLPILQNNRITIRKDDDGVTRIYLPNRRKIFECINSSGMIFYGRNEYKPNLIILYGLNIFGFGKYDRELNQAVSYHGESCIASGGCNIRVNNCNFKNIGGKSIYIRDTEKAMNTEYCLVDNNKFFNIGDSCVSAQQINGITSINNNNFKFCCLNILGINGSGIISASSEIGTYIFKNRITEFNSSSVINASSNGTIVIVEDNYIKNSAEFIANYKKSLMMSDAGIIYSGNRTKAIIRNNYIDGVFGDWTYRVIYGDDGSWDKTVYGNMILRADIENDNKYSGSIYFNPQSGEELKNSNNIIINNIVSRRYYIVDANNVERPCYVGKNLLIGIGAGQISTNSSVQNLENDIADKQAIIQDGELYTELDVSKMFIGGESLKHIHHWKDIHK